MKIVSLAIFFTFISSSVIYAKSKLNFWVEIGPENTQLKKMGDGFINRDCQHCEAIKLTKRPFVTNQAKAFNKNPSSLACTENKGEVRIGKLFNGHSQSFCLFKDGSMASNNLWVIQIQKAK